MDKQTAEQKAIEILKQVVDAISERRYGDIPSLAYTGWWTGQRLEKIIEDFLQASSLSGMDRWDVTQGTPSPNPKYQQLNFYHFNNGSGFHVDYDLTTDGELNDLTLQMEFLYEGEGLRPVFLGLHVL